MTWQPISALPDHDWSGFASFAVQPRAPILGGKWRYEVVANGWVTVAFHDTMEAASQHAARLNYERRDISYLPRQIGLDGLAA